MAVLCSIINNSYGKWKRIRNRWLTLNHFPENNFILFPGANVLQLIIPHHQPISTVNRTAIHQPLWISASLSFHPIEVLTLWRSLNCRKSWWQQQVSLWLGTAGKWWREWKPIYCGSTLSSPSVSPQLIKFPWRGEEEVWSKLIIK